VRSPGNPAYVFYLLLVVRLLLSWRRDPARYRSWLAAAPPRWRILTATIALPIAVWFLIPYPNRFRDFFAFLTNADEGARFWTLEALLFYPRAIADHYSLAPAVGWSVLVLAVLPLRSGGANAPLRVVRLALVLGLLACAVHRFHAPRFLFTVMPVIWLAAAWNAAALVESLLARIPSPTLVRAAWAVGCAGLLVVAALARPPAEEIAAQRRGYGVPADVRPALDRTLAAAAAHPDAWLLGYCNWVSSALLAWHARLGGSATPALPLPKRLPSLPEGADASAIEDRLARIEHSGKTVVSALALPASPLHSPAYRHETWADSVTADRLALSARFSPISDDTIPGAGFRVRIFQPAEVLLGRR
jgi:hypothetical protein